MAGVEEPAAGADVRAGVLSKLARAQYGALAAMRWSMFRHGMRSTKGAVEAGARMVAVLMYSLHGHGAGLGFGMGAYAMCCSRAAGRCCRF